MASSQPSLPLPSDVQSAMESLLSGLHYDFRQFDLLQFLDWIRGTHATEILPVSIPMPPELFGAWVHANSPTCEYIFFDAKLPPFHQAHIILHEICHYLCEHGTKICTHADVLALIEHAEKGDMEYVRRFFGSDIRQRSEDRHSLKEQQAETLALLIQEQVDDQSRLHALTVRETSNEDLRRFLSKIGILTEQ